MRHGPGNQQATRKLFSLDGIELAEQRGFAGFFARLLLSLLLGKCPVEDLCPNVAAAVPLMDRDPSLLLLSRCSAPSRHSPLIPLVLC